MGITLELSSLLHWLARGTRTSRGAGGVTAAAAPTGHSVAAPGPTPLPDDGPATSENRVVALMRFVLALSGLATVFVDPAEPDRLVAATYLALLCYCTYSLALYVLAVRQVVPSRRFQWTHWMDLAWFSLLVALSSGTQSIFFFGFVFSIMVAAFRWGFASGLRVTLVSLLLFGIMGYATSPAEHFEVNRFVIRPAYLVVMGYLLSYWGGYQLTLTRRLALLREVSALANPRFGVERTLDNALELICRFYSADSIVLLTMEPGETGVLVRRRPIGIEGAGVQVVPLVAVESLLLSATGGFAAVQLQKRAVRPQLIAAGARPSDERISELIDHFNAKTLLTVPWPQRGQVTGRLYLVWHHVRHLERSDVDFVAQIVGQIMPVLENVQLLDRLASDAADVERQRIARDLHDSVVQPYIGVHMGLRGIREKLRQRRDVLPDLERLEGVLELEIQQLRGYLSDMKTSGVAQGIFRGALQRFAQRYAEVTGIAVELQVADDLPLNDRLAAEAFQMIAEALSNVRRHTEAVAAVVRIWISDDQLHLRVSDRARDPGSLEPFTPRSIAERVQALGGKLNVFPDETGSIVGISIPL